MFSQIYPNNLFANNKYRKFVIFLYFAENIKDIIIS